MFINITNITYEYLFLGHILGFRGNDSFLQQPVVSIFVWLDVSTKASFHEIYDDPSSKSHDIHKTSFSRYCFANQ